MLIAKAAYQLYSSVIFSFLLGVLQFPRVQMYAFQQVEDELEMVDDGLPVHRSKRRLLLTTQLMQILLHPPLALILSADAILHYETAAYFVARSTLGDACSTFSCTGSDTPVPSNSGDL